MRFVMILRAGQILGPEQPEMFTGQPLFILAMPDRATKFSWFWNV
jgi:hypothetical protein